MFSKILIFFFVAVCLIGSLALAYPAAEPIRLHSGAYHPHQHWGGQFGFSGHHYGGWGHHGYGGPYIGFRPHRPYYHG